MGTLNEVIRGALILASATVALFLLRFFRDTRDRFFAFFAGSFAILSIHWAILTFTSPRAEHRPLFFLLRLVAFVFLIVAILDKNRPRR
jgi:hypothetical protein